VTETVRDHWAEWLLERRFGGDSARHERAMDHLARVRERVLDNASVGEGETLLDVGAGDGLIAFGALERVGPNGRVIFSDVSEDLLAHSRALTEQAGIVDRCEFVLASADQLTSIGDASVDVVTTRSVLIYLDREHKRSALAEFHRVLRAGGRVSIFEPINSFGHPEPEGWFCGYDLTAITELAAKVLAVASPEEEETLIDFDERDLLRWAEDAGFEPIRLEYEVDVKPGSWLAGTWDSVLRSSGNPLAPTLGESLERALTPEERRVFEAHLRPLVEADAGRGRGAVAYLAATKSEL
jgi:ubiquinone/menaquinone biosynthesis C-methylase UbiE